MATNSNKDFARSAFGVRGVLAPLFGPRLAQSKATRGRVALRTFREIGTKMLSYSRSLALFAGSSSGCGGAALGNLRFLRFNTSTLPWHAVALAKAAAI